MVLEDKKLSPGDVLDKKYSVVRLVGSGGMGEVYEAAHLSIGRKVAIKRLRAKYRQRPDAVQRFQQEAEHAGSIGHDNICEVTDIGVDDDGVPFLVMPLLAGASLAEILATGRSLTTHRITDIIGQVLSALGAAHAVQIIHRDLKPSNIFVTRMGDRFDFVKLLDFGISKVLGTTPVEEELTTTGVVLGTPYYMAPEQARGAKEIDPRTDLYAVGVILYELLTGKKPFQGSSYNELLFRITSEPFLAPSAVAPNVPRTLEKVVLKAMSRHPDDRYGSAREMRSALVAAVGESATIDSWPQQNSADLAEHDALALARSQDPTNTPSDRNSTTIATMGDGSFTPISSDSNPTPKQGPGGLSPPDELADVDSSEDSPRVARSLFVLAGLGVIGVVIVGWVFWPPAVDDEPGGMVSPPAQQAHVEADGQATVESSTTVDDSPVLPDAGPAIQAQMADVPENIGETSKEPTEKEELEAPVRQKKKRPRHPSKKTPKVPVNDDQTPQKAATDSDKSVKGRYGTKITTSF